MSKGKPIGTCRTCKSEIVEGVNASVFGDGECESCERLRYRTQPQVREFIEDLVTEPEPIEDDDEREKTIFEAKELLAQARGEDALPPATEIDPRHVFTLTEEDFQTIAEERVGRRLTDPELRTAIRYFESGNNWAEITQIAIDLTVEDHANAA